MNLKKLYIFLLCVSIILCLTGCGESNPNKNIETESDSKDSLEIASYEPLYERETEEPETEAETMTSADGVDVDLTVLSPTMVFAEVYNMMATPDDYIGKIVRISGKYYSVTSQENGKTYFYVLIKDATACCEQGMEFIWDNGSHVYPDEYPEEESDVTITGAFQTYKEDGLTYCYLDIDGFDE